MKNILLKLAVAVLMFSFNVCKPSYITKTSEQSSLNRSSKLYIIKSYTSIRLPHMMRPSYKQLENQNENCKIMWTVPAYREIDKLIYYSLNGKRYEVAIVESESEVDEGIYIKYSDYWTWDLTRYMHLLKLKVYEKGKVEPVAVAVLEGSKSEFHNFPRPKKEIPILIDKLFL